MWATQCGAYMFACLRVWVELVHVCINGCMHVGTHGMHLVRVFVVVSVFVSAFVSGACMRACMHACMHVMVVCVHVCRCVHVRGASACLACINVIHMCGRLGRCE